MTAASCPESSASDFKASFQAFVHTLQHTICEAFEALEARGEHRPARFERTRWERPGGGGGTMALMRGKVFEKVGVNVSEVWGELDESFRHQIPGASLDPSFWACGLSLVAHMASPLVPAVHMNIRHIVTTRAWFGGGTDLTPCFPDPEDTAFFHQVLKQTCDRHHPDYYPRFSKACDDYFFLSHRQEPRGVGGLFFDGLNSGDLNADARFAQDVGLAFLEAFVPLVERNRDKPWTADQRLALLRKRGRYVEFNLLYDRGTLFGLKTGGNIEAILMSLPPEVRWDGP